MQRVEPDRLDEWTTEMERPFPVVGKQRMPTQRELELEADGFASLYAQVNSR